MTKHVWAYETTPSVPAAGKLLFWKATIVVFLQVLESARELTLFSLF